VGSLSLSCLAEFQNGFQCFPSVTECLPLHGRPQDFFQGWAIRGSEGRKSPNRVQEQFPSKGLEGKPLEADDIFSK